MVHITRKKNIPSTIRGKAASIRGYMYMYSRVVNEDSVEHYCEEL